MLQYEHGIHATAMGGLHSRQRVEVARAWGKTRGFAVPNGEPEGAALTKLEGERRGGGLAAFRL